MPTRTLYSVDLIKQKLDFEVQVGGYLGKTITQRHAVALSWAPGMVGAIPVFETRKAAEAYQNGCTEYPIAELTIDEPVRQ